jgi:short-subunit dehydrogenase
MGLPQPSPYTTAVVTGASSGIGAEIARQLAGRGHGLTLVARREDLLTALARELREAVRVEVIACDLTEPTERARLFDELARRGLEVDVLINNAGMGNLRSVVDARIDDEIALIRVNVEAIVDLATRAARGMSRHGRGAILNVGSITSLVPSPGAASYAGSKAFVNVFTRNLRSEIAADGITVAAVCPGPVHTGFFAAAQANEEELGLPRFFYETVAQVAASAIGALERDRGFVVVGRWPRVMTTVVGLIPDRLLAPLVAWGFARRSRRRVEAQPTR